MNDNTNMDSTEAGSMNVCSNCLLARKVEYGMKYHCETEINLYLTRG